MNDFKRAITLEVKRHGVEVQYIETKKVQDIINGTTINTEVKISIPKAYPKQEKATQYNFPNLVGKEVISFRILPDDCTPVINAEIVYKNKKYKIDTIREHMALGEVILYICTAAYG